MKRIPFPLVAAALAAVVALAPTADFVAPAAAQVVEGTVRDADRDRPLPRARLLLIDDAGAAIDSVLADRDGRFRLAAPGAGAYHVLFQLDGWVSVPSGPVRLDDGSTATLDFRVPLVSVAALDQLGELIRMERHLQDALPEICGEAFRPWEAGLLVGVVRLRATREPIPGARVTVVSMEDDVARTTLSNERGTYILCNVPTGPAIEITAEAPDGPSESITVEIRAGTASWYDLPLGPRRR